MTKTLITVGCAITLQVEVDESRLNDPDYVATIQKKACEEAGKEFNWKDLIVTDCEDFPELAE
jgi:hypothetical protein